jgi:hypothetical protein
MTGKAAIRSVESGRSEQENQHEAEQDIESETLPPSCAQALRRFKGAPQVHHSSL